eukprot:COSAG02_NODE_36838_length_449_cov_22.594286_1_plen_30_part_01
MKRVYGKHTQRDSAYSDAMATGMKPVFNHR